MENRRITRSLAALVLVSGLVAPQAAAAPEDAPRHQSVSSDLSSMDSQLFHQLAVVHRTFEKHAAQIWSTGYRPDLKPLLIGHLPPGTVIGSDTRPTYAFLIGHPDPAAVGNAEPVALPRGLGLPPVYRITDGPGIDRIGATFFDSAKLGGSDSLLFSVLQGDPTLDPATDFFRRFFVHEAFHNYQNGWTPVAPDQPDPQTYPRTSERALALALLEGEVLDASRHPTPVQARRTVRTVLAIRAEREELQPAIRQFEPYTEQIEGTARFVEDRFDTVLLGAAPKDDQPPAEARLLLGYFASTRAYETGADVGRLLESMREPQWRRLVSRAGSPLGVAAQLVGVPSGAHRAQLVSAAERRHNYPALLATVRAAHLEDL